MKLMSALLATLLLAGPAWAEEAKKEGEAEAPKVAYVNLTPALVGNYGAGAKLKYFKADISLQTGGPEVAKKVEYHEPLIRNQLIMLFSQQTDDSLNGVENKEKLRQEALKEVQQVLNTEEGAPLVDDLLFNNLIIQP
ncbi:flagellar basal body-associated FliL family protein [Pseudomonas sp. RIT-PI-AD]|uniref:flagellar basal body-associated FliL family protein n=1 Tax=Pseudomonas sp. RIT-PI-AD TaxID=3035294 RepID=UPI0021D8E426|nr:flagellar basal body-associated FliL family protein [Pseudomonas sp. RIT-PI-AD]